jgi:putative membrane protein
MMPVQVDRTREHLANERTYLAWVRTGLGLIGLGFVLARMGLFLQQLALASMPQVRDRFQGGHEFVVSGVVFLLLGIVVCGWSARRYQQSRRAIDAGEFEPAGRSVVMLSTVVVVGGLAIVGLVFWRVLGT